MKLSEIVSENLIFPELKGTNVSGILQEFAQSICQSGKFSDASKIYDRLMQRENQESTGIGNGIAIPHCKIEDLNEVILAVGYSSAGVDFKAIDGNKTFFFFLVLANSPTLTLRTLSAISKLLRSPNFMAQLQKRPGKSELVNLIREEEGTLVK